MALKIADPVTFLRNLVSKKGKSDLYGVYLTSVNVVADSQIDYEYEAPPDDIARALKNLFLQLIMIITLMTRQRHHNI